jgi:hypothetical protein
MCYDASMNQEATMDEARATSIADALGGEPWQSGGGIWLVLLRRPDGHIVVLSDESVCEFDDQDAFDEGRAKSMILLR